ncbi:MAG: enoyl-CoA hydratase/isomerase family protein [Desulfobacteraceae bacterium]|jgi:enoyl-CoA hydratase/carnithine racemase
MEFENLIVQSHENIAHVQMNRPEVMNTLNQELINDLYRCLTALEKDPNVRVVVLSGAGRAFCAGGDVSFLKVISELSHAGTRQLLKELFHKLTVLARVEKPVVGALHGYVLGAGFGLSLLCDFRVAAESTTFGVEFVNMGIVPEIGVTHIFPSLVGLGKAMELAMTGRRFDAKEAEKVGVVNRVFSDGALMEQAMKLAGHMAALPPLALGWTKMALRKGLSSSLEESMALEANINALCYQSEDHKEAARAFLEKRNPVFKGH